MQAVDTNGSTVTYSIFAGIDDIANKKREQVFPAPAPDPVPTATAKSTVVPVSDSTTYKLSDALWDLYDAIPDIIGNLYYYPDLDQLIEALESGRDISPLISYQGIHNHSKGRSTDLLPQINHHNKIYIRDNMTFVVYDRVVSALYGFDAVNNYLSKNGYAAVDNYLVYSDFEDFLDLVNSEATTGDELQHELDQFYHRLVCVSISLGDHVKRYYLTDEPIENFKLRELPTFTLTCVCYDGNYEYDGYYFGESVLIPDQVMNSTYEDDGVTYTYNGVEESLDNLRFTKDITLHVLYHVPSEG